MKPDPRPRPDGTCPVCGHQRPDPPKRSQNPNLTRDLASDPFDTTDCARQWHGADLPETTQQRGQRERRRREEAA